MVIVTLIVTLASAMVWQQWRAVQVETAERARAQSAWILSGALDWARLILKEDLRSGRPTALTEPWATPLAEARLSTFLAADKSNADDGPEAFLSGSISDAQGRYNLTNLAPAGGKVDALEQAALERLCLAIGLESSVVQRIANGMRDAGATGAASGATANAPLLPQSVTQLAWFGLDDATIKALESFPANIHLILGGKDKGSDYTLLNELLRQRVKRVYTIGSAAGKIESQISAPIAGHTELVYAETLANAVHKAHAAAQPGDVVLLAPACASFDQFENYEHRGRVFKSLVKELELACHSN